MNQRVRTWCVLSVIAVGLAASTLTVAVWATCECPQECPSVDNWEVGTAPESGGWIRGKLCPGDDWESKGMWHIPQGLSMDFEVVPLNGRDGDHCDCVPPGDLEESVKYEWQIKRPGSEEYGESIWGTQAHYSFPSLGVHAIRINLDDEGCCYDDNKIEQWRLFYVKTVEIACVEITASSDYDLHWADGPSDENLIWQANLTTFQNTGTISVVVDRKAIVYDFNDDAEYNLNFTLATHPYYPSLEFTPTLQVVLSGDPNATRSAEGWSPQISVPERDYVFKRAFGMALTFKVCDTAVPKSTQTISGWKDYAVYDSYKGSDRNTDYVENRIELSVDWGKWGNCLKKDEWDDQGGDKSIPWKVRGSISTEGYSDDPLQNPWLLCSQTGNCNAHARLMEAVLGDLGVPGDPVNYHLPLPQTRACAETYWYPPTPPNQQYRHDSFGQEELNHFRYNCTQKEFNDHWCCAVVTADAGTIWYDCLHKVDGETGSRPYGPESEMTNKDQDSGNDCLHDFVNGWGWIWQCADENLYCHWEY